MWVQKVVGSGIEGLAYSPDGRTLYVAAGFRVTAWDTTTREGRPLPGTQYEFADEIGGLVLIGHGRFLAVKSHPLVVWDTVSEARHLGARTQRPEHVVPWPGRERIVALDHDRRSLLAYGPDGRWAEYPDRVHTGDELIETYDIAPDGRAAAVVEVQTREVKQLELGTGREVGRLRIKGGAGLPSLVRFSPDGRTLAVVCGKQIHLADVALAAFRDHRINIKAACSVLAFHPTAPVIGAVNPDKVFTLFGTDTGQPIRSLDFALGKRVTSAAFAPDGLTCAVGGSNRQFAVFDVNL
jgi:WD40 repeat protein